MMAQLATWREDAHADKTGKGQTHLDSKVTDTSGTFTDDSKSDAAASKTFERRHALPLSMWDTQSGQQQQPGRTNVAIRRPKH
jgi:hypothetical protein